MDRLEATLRHTADSFSYPPTPDVAGAVKRRLASEPRAIARPRPRLAWAMAALVVALTAGLLSVPQVRASLAEFIRIGAVRIFLVPPTPTPPSTALPSPAPGAVSVPTATPLASVLDLAGETTLENARASAGFPIRLPSYPDDLGAPDRVFFQNLDGDVVMLVWTFPEEPNRVRLALHEIEPSSFTVSKLQPRNIQQTSVGGHPAIWAEGPYMVQTRAQAIEETRLVAGHVLIWTESDVTYRLEADLPLEEAVRIAESLR